MAIATLEGPPPTQIESLAEAEPARAACHVCSQFGSKVCGFLQAVWKAAERKRGFGDDYAPFFPEEVRNQRLDSKRR